jgi:DNA-directed RNA polymerase specialized sigma24 family protein
MVNELPNGYKNVFCLNTIEGYSHKEIGEMLNITVNTSKSQLTRARVSLQRKYNKLSDYNSNKPNILQSA